MGLTMAATKKAPQDHKPKAVLTDGVYTVKLRGVAVKIEADALDDFELLADLADLSDGNAAKTVSLFRRLAGDQAGEITESLRGSNGRVKASDVSEFLGELFGAINPNS